MVAVVSFYLNFQWIQFEFSDATDLEVPLADQADGEEVKFGELKILNSI